MRLFRVGLAGLLTVLTVGTTLIAPVAAEEPGNSAFFRTWQRTDWPVREQLAQRSWIWGPEAFTSELVESYEEAPGNERIVQYYDKSRMEITFPDADPESDFFVTNGLLVVELITGRMQVGDNAFDERSPATVNVAGDAGDPNGPTYASFVDLLAETPHALDQPIIQTVDRLGGVGMDESLAAQNVRVALVDDVTNHSIPQPFWDFMNASGPVVEDGTVRDDELFQNPYFATGRPITEPYWATVEVSTIAQQVLIQCFERRCLTYTPGNSPGFITEAGNVGQHYYAWRYGDANPPAAPEITIPSQASWRQVAPGDGPGSRSDHSLVSDVAGGIVYLFGGRSGGVDLGDLWAFDVASEQWSLLSEAGPSPRFGHNAVYDARRDRVVVYGGQAGPSFFSDVWAWDVASSSWALVADSGSGPLARYGAAGAYDGLTNSMLVSHGFTSAGRFDDTWRFDLTTDVWQEISPGSGFTRPEPRCLLRGVADPHHGRFYIFGGQSNTSSYLGDFWEYDIAARNWVPVAGDRPAPRNFYAATAGQESRYLLLHGGNVGGVAGNDLWLFDFATEDWKTLPSTGGDAPAMSSHDAVWTTSGMLVFGGGGQTWIAALS